MFDLSVTAQKARLSISLTDTNLLFASMAVLFSFDTFFVMPGREISSRLAKFGCLTH